MKIEKSCFGRKIDFLSGGAPLNENDFYPHPKRGRSARRFYPFYQTLCLLQATEVIENVLC
jgi:hypothetical protein